MQPTPSRSNRELLVPYLLPLLLWVGLGLLEHLGRETVYALRLVGCAGVLLWAQRRYISLLGPESPLTSVALGVAGGLAGTVVWIGLLAPFAGPGTPWTPTAFLLRAATATFLVPVFEELVMRGYLLRFVLQWEAARRSDSKDALGETLDRRSIGEVEPGAWSPLAVAISTLVFAFGHAPAEWLAATAYGAMMSSRWIVRRDLISCVVAHGITNLALAIWVQRTDAWGLW